MRAFLAALVGLALGSIVEVIIFGDASTASSQGPQRPVFRSGVNLVQVDVVALDAMNRLVTDLAKEDFEVLEDGARQEIVSFERVELPVPPPRPPAMADVATSAGAGEGRMIFLVLDDPNSLASRADAIRQAARRFPGWAPVDLPLDPETGMSGESVRLAGLDVKALFDADRPFVIVQDVSRYLVGVEGRRKAIVYIGQKEV